MMEKTKEEYFKAMCDINEIQKHCVSKDKIMDSMDENMKKYIDKLYANNSEIWFQYIEDFDEKNIKVSIIDMIQAEYANSLPQSHQSCLSYDDGIRTIDVCWDDFLNFTRGENNK